MKPKNIGGWIDYAKLAQQHRPEDPQLFAAEVRRLAANGLMPRDISQALKVSLPVVMEILRGVP